MPTSKAHSTYPAVRRTQVHMQVRTRVNAQLFAAHGHELTSTNDGGISLGQVAAASARRVSKEQ